MNAAHGARTAPNPPLERRERFERLDAWRGAAIVWMLAFHLSFDLNHYRWIAPQNFYDDPFWTGQRTAIVGLFLWTAGVSQAVAMRDRIEWRRFWRRWLQIAGCALAVSIGSAWMFPQRWISFGVLHGIAAMLILVRLLAPLGNGAISSIGIAAMLLPRFVAHPFFDSRWTDWIGLVTHKPPTEDFVPLLPWAGVMLVGFAAGRVLLAQRPALLSGPPVPALRPLAALGRWPLTVYMLHQPILIGLIAAATMLR